MHKGIDRKAAAQIEDADSFWGVELVAGKRKHIDLLNADIDGNLTDRLYCVGVEWDPGLPADRPDLGNRKNGANLVVGIHDADQCGIGPDSLPYLSGGDQPLAVDRQIGNLKAFLFQHLHGMQHRVMLKIGGNEMPLPFPRSRRRRTFDRPVVRLGAAGGKIDFRGLGVERFGDLLAGGFQRFFGLAPLRVDARGIAIPLGQIGEHCVENGFGNRGGCRMIRVYKAFFHDDTSRTAEPPSSLCGCQRRSGY